MKYRPDIDGLRAVAVLAVILFHLRIAPFTGGFVGVDVFFVISGFLITSLILEDIQRGQFSILAFYERRARRILPALFLVLIFCSIAVALVGDLDNTRDFGGRLMATVLFVANIQFWMTSGYFDAPSHANPLLHTWSLAVEEQFYLAFPLFLLAVSWWLKKRWVQWASVFLLISFAINLWLTRAAPSAAFFLGVPRSWELLIGSLLALGAVPAVRAPAVREAMAVAGVAAILGAVLLINSETAFPGYAALLPCLGTALLIHAGGDTVIGRGLSLRPVVFVGLISYSLYLWHWPLIVFAEYQFIDIKLPIVKGAIIAISFVAAVLSWRFVELPFRRKGFGKRRQVFAWAAAGLVGFSLVGMSASQSGWLERFPPEARRLVAYSKSYEPRRDECRGKVEEACVYGAAVEPAYVLWGDSHADAVMPAIDSAAERNHQAVRLYYLPSCPPTLGFASPRRRCSSFQERVLAAIESNPDVQTVILVVRYSYYFDAPALATGDSIEESETSDTFIDARRRPIPRVDRERIFAESLRNTVQRLSARGLKIALVYPVPEPGYDVPHRAAFATWRGLVPLAPNTAFDVFVARQAQAFEILDSIVVPAIRVYPHRRLCTDTFCVTYLGGEPLYRDDNHLSLPGAAFVSPAFDPIFAGTVDATALTTNGTIERPGVNELRK